MEKRTNMLSDSNTHVLGKISYLVANSGTCDILTGPLSEACSKDNKENQVKLMHP